MACCRATQWSLLKAAVASIIRATMTPLHSPRTQPARLVLLVGALLRSDAAISQTLAREGLRCLWLPSLQRALDTARLARFDAAVLDSGDVGGVTEPTLAQLRQRLRCPLVLVAQQADEVDEILALEMGADAFLVRPLAPRRLRAHLLALLRHPALPATPDLPASPPPARWEDWSLDTQSGSLIGRGRRVELTLLQGSLMRCLVEAAGRVVSHAQLTSALPRGQQLAAQSVCVYVARLRKKLREAGVHELRVESVRGRGFALRTAPQGPREVAPMMQAA